MDPLYLSATVDLTQLPAEGYFVDAPVRESAARYVRADARARRRVTRNPGFLSRAVLLIGFVTREIAAHAAQLPAPSAKGRL